MSTLLSEDQIRNGLVRRILSQDTRIDEALSLAADLAIRMTAGETCHLFTQEIWNSGQPIREKSGGRVIGQEVSEEIVRIVARMVEKGEPAIVAFPESAESISHVQDTDSDQLLLLYAPIISGEAILGGLCVLKSASALQRDEDIDSLSTVADLLAARIDRTSNHDEMVQLKRIKDDLEVASSIQKRLQPASAKLAGWDIAIHSVPLFELGGDYHDFIKRKKDGRAVVVVGDISGKGLGAALLMVLLRTVVQTQSQAVLHPDEAMDEINLYLFENTPPNKFATLFYAQINHKNDLLTYCNAGHNPPIVVRGSENIERLEAGGLAAGMFLGATYEEDVISIEPGDVLVIYTDGYTEAVDENGEEFGESGLVEVVRENRSKCASELREMIEEKLKLFVGSGTLADDRTLVIMKRETEKI